MLIDRRAMLGIGAVAIATVTAFVFAAAAETVWFALKTGRSIVPLVEANFSFSARVAPSWWAAAITAAIAVAAIMVRRTAIRPPSARERKDLS
jgi:hypothetical protein